MTDTFLDFGEPLTDQSPAALAVSAARATYAALQARSDFKLVELRRHGDGDAASEVLVVDCFCDGVPTKSQVGIHYRERLALRFFRSASKLPEVRALRASFPLTMHQNRVGPGEPKALCLYFEPWTALERAWTPQKHLQRILWWLSETANGSLHQEDQPLEPLYFDSPLELILPADFAAKLSAGAQPLAIVDRFPRDGTGDGHTVYIADYPQEAARAKQRGLLSLACIAVQLPPIQHGSVEPFPGTLGELHDQMEQREVSLVRILSQQVGQLAEGKEGLAKSTEQFTLLVLSIPMVRTMGGPQERTVLRGFVVSAGLGELGVKLGALFRNGEKFFRDHQLIPRDPRIEWRAIQLMPLTVTPRFTKALAREAGGTPLDSTSQPFVLAGVGALGSMMLNLWHRAGWGEWTLMDPDRLKPHNLARHTAVSDYVGWSKVEIGMSLEAHLFSEAEASTQAVFQPANNFANPDVNQALSDAVLVVDATTTLEVPRDFATHDGVKRACSTFLTPSGAGCVLLFEDEKRSVRLDALEAQYYRAVLNQEWGREHLHGHLGRLWVGAGCRDVSTIIPNTRVALSASILAQQVVQQQARPGAAIQVWHQDVESGAVTTAKVQPEAPLWVELSGWRLLWDEGMRRQVRALRDASAPRETGGILVGYFDNKQRRIYVVDALPPPRDSVGDVTGFIRGVEGVRKHILEAERRTAGIVTYVGEWHSHPPGVSARPSSDDERLVSHLARELARDGYPALILIVGEGEERWVCREGGSGL